VQKLTAGGKGLRNEDRNPEPHDLGGIKNLKFGGKEKEIGENGRPYSDVNSSSCPLHGIGRQERGKRNRVGDVDEEN